MSNKTEDIVKQLSELTVMEMSELKKALEDAWGVTAAAPAAVMAAAPAAGDNAAEAEEASAFEITLTEVPADKKIAVIKVVREVTGLGLKEAKDVAESPPKVIKDSATPADAEEIKKKFEAAGAKVTLKGV